MIVIIIKNVHYNVKKKKLCTLISVCMSFEQHVAVVPSAGHSEAMHLRLLFLPEKYSTCENIVTTTDMMTI